MIARSANPGLNKKTFSLVRDFAQRDNLMTLQGTVNKTGIMLFPGYIWTILTTLRPTGL